MRRAFDILRHSIATKVSLWVLLLLIGAAVVAVGTQSTTIMRNSTTANYDAILQEYLDRSPASNADFADFLNTKLVRATMRKNPDFGYFFRQGDRIFSSRPPGPWYARFYGGGRVPPDAGNPSICQIFSVENGPRSEQSYYVSYGNCGVESYAELSGITTPIDLEPFVSQPFGTTLYLKLTEHWILALLAVVIIACTFGLILQSFRKVRLLAEDFDIRSAQMELDHAGVPIEVRPLIRIINDLAGKLHQFHVQQKLFLASAAHELRTPLAIIRINLENLADSREKDELRDEAEHLSDIVNQLLDLIGIDHLGKERGVVEPARLCRDAIEDMRRLAPETPIRLCLPDGGAPRLYGNAQLLGIALDNLLRNAASVSPPGAAIVLRVTAEGRISVTDAGPGISPRVADRLFEPFVKHPSDRTGSGLGLAIVREIAAFHRGTVTVENNPEGGAVFTIDLTTAAQV